MSRVSYVAVGIFAIVVLTPRSDAQPQYKLVSQPGAASAGSRVYGVNNAGQSVGFSVVGEDHQSTHWASGVVTNLQDSIHFTLLNIFNLPYSEAYAISDDDQIVGTARYTLKCGDEEITKSTAYIMRPAVLSDLATPYPGDALVNLDSLGDPCVALDSAAVGISNAGHVVGWADTGIGATHAFLVTPVNGTYFVDADTNLVNDLLVDLGTLDNRSTVSSATAVNDAGQVTGYSYTTTYTFNGKSAYHAFLVTPQGGSWNVDNNADTINDLMLSLGTLGGPNSWGRAINNSGVVVGEADTDEYHTHAFIYQNGQIADLGTLGGQNSSAAAINDDGDVVGWAETESGQRRAFVYTNGRMYDLNELLLITDEGEITLTEARDINNEGLIVGFGKTTTGTETVESAFALRLPTEDEVKEAEELEALLAGQVQGATSDSGIGSGGTGAGGAFGIPISGTPGSLGDAASGDANSDGGSVAPAANAACGLGFVGMLPLTALALLGVRRR